ncbi:hypothetical protein [Phycicoccus sonneratiae]|uniref:Uncharacterized protein n=1 Tax=Phycicoccus sonneratiae TaxID=2807628 RepID=A0ABS2CLM9_9MICO|nr:hypothetical protein [Phycicoccus sonneraticus]MBM6400788.1 hypothetical protein [Phycicoccus sonneraticus]
MSHDVFEDELRARLLGATEAEAPAFHDIDTAEVLGTGRRIVRRRRMAAVGGTLAAVTVLGAGSWAVLDGTTNRAADEIPATRSSGPQVAPDVVSVSLPAGDGGAVPVYTVHLERRTGRVTVASVSAAGTATDLGDVGRVPADRPSAVYATVSHDPFVAVGVVPADAEQLMPRFTGGDLGGVSTEEGALPTTTWKAFLVHSEKSPADADLTGLDWAGGGRVFDEGGRQLPSAGLGDRTVYLDTAGGEVGVVTADGSARSPLSSTPAGDPPHVTTAVKQDGRPTVTTTALVLPIDAQDVLVEAAPGATLRSSDTAPLFDGAGLAVVAVVEGPDSAVPAVARVRWTVDGAARDWTPSG